MIDAPLEVRAVAESARTVIPVTLPPGTRLGLYEIVAPLGAGGMGEVYRARDTRLGRAVAIKVLRDTAETPTRRQRFEREARATSRLNHPHICALYDVGEDDGRRYLVMEYVEGETLARRLRSGPLPLSELFKFAIQIADAMDHAHRAGIVHRDLKPANVILTAAGAKLLDFGLAQWHEESTLATAHSGEWRETVTEEGTIVGTVPYMAPEQLEGRKADGRTDIFAFGALVYEMATGRAAFDGPSKASVIAAVLNHELKPLSAARAVVTPDGSTPPLLDQIVARCLSKNPDDRWQTARDLRQALAWIGNGGVATTTGPIALRHGSRAISRREYVAWGLAATLFGIVAAMSVVRFGEAITAPGVARTAILFGDETLSRRFSSDRPLALSPDGSRLAYVAAGPDREQLYVRDLSELNASPLAGTTGARQPFFSPDGKWIAFFSPDGLMKVPVSGGAPTLITAVPGRPGGGTWSPSGTIVFSAEQMLFSVSANGGPPRRLEAAGRGRWPEVLPDGETLLYTRGTAILATSLDGRTTRTIARTTPDVSAGPGDNDDVTQSAASLGASAIAQAHYLPTGHLVYGQNPGAIRAVAFDRATLTVTSAPVSLVEGVYRGSNGTSVYYAVSRSGLLVYAPENPQRTLVWADRVGRATPVTDDRQAFTQPRLSPDGQRIAVSIHDDTRRSDIWVYDVTSRTRTRLTAEHHNLGIVWTPNGTHVTYSWSPAGVFLVPRDGGSPRALLQDRPAALSRRPIYSSSWSADARQLLAWTLAANNGEDIWELQDGTARPLLVSAADEKFGQFSPDGKWIAFQSNESGRDEVYVARYPDLTSKTAVSNRGGGYPMWSPAGRELFYRQGSAMMAVAVEMSNTFGAAPPTLLFDDPSYVGASGDLRFDVARDGQQFLTPRAVDPSTARQLVVVSNWFEDVKRRFAASR
jgi:serine/threonine-protein kinase